MDNHNPIINAKSSCDDHNARIKQLRQDLDACERSSYSAMMIVSALSFLIGLSAGLWGNL